MDRDKTKEMIKGIIATLSLSSIRKGAFRRGITDCIWRDLERIRNKEDYEIKSRLKELNGTFLSSLVARVTEGNQTCTDIMKWIKSQDGMDYLIRDVLHHQCRAGNRNALEVLLFIMTSMNDEDEGDDAKEAFVEACGNEGVRKSAITLLRVWAEKRSELMPLMNDIDSEVAVPRCLEWLGQKDYRKNGIAMDVLSSHELSPEQLSGILPGFRLWTRREIRRKADIRNAYYLLVRKAFSAGVIDRKQALGCIRPAFLYESSKAGMENLFELTKLIHPKQHREVIARGLIARERKHIDPVHWLFYQEVLEKFIGMLEPQDRLDFLFRLIDQSENDETIYSATIKAIKISYELDCVGRAMKFFRAKLKDRKKSRTLGDMLSGIWSSAGGTGLKDIPSDVLTGFGNLVLEAVPRESSLSTKIALLEKIVSNARDAYMIHIPPFMEEFIESKTYFRKALVLMLVCWSRDDSVEEWAKGFLDKAYEKRKDSLIGELQRILRGGRNVHDEYDDLDYVALESLDYLNPDGIIPFIGNLLLRHRGDCDNDYGLRELLAEFLTKRAIDGSVEAVDFLIRKNDKGIEFGRIPDTLLRISKEARDKGVREKAVDGLASRFKLSMNGSGDDFSPYEVVKAMKELRGSENVQKAYLEGLEYLVSNKHLVPGMASIVEMASQIVVSGRKRKQAEKTLRLITENMKERLARSSYRDSQHEAAEHILTAVSKEMLRFVVS